MLSMRVFMHFCVTENVHGVDQQNYLKWLRYDLDFCEKYEHPPGLSFPRTVGPPEDLFYVYAKQVRMPF